MFKSVPYRLYRLKEDLKYAFTNAVAVLPNNGPAPDDAQKKKYSDSQIKKYLNSNKYRTKNLQLGSWPNVFKGWLNTDINTDEESGLVILDLLKPFPLPDESIDYIFCEHTIEHFSFDQGQKILSECFRVMKRNGIIRFSTPNLKFLIDLYDNKKSKVQQNYITWVAKEFPQSVPFALDVFVINNFVRAWGHQFIYDLKSLRMAFEMAGFQSITECKNGESKHKQLQGLETHGKVIGESNNFLETMILEAKKSN